MLRQTFFAIAAVAAFAAAGSTAMAGGYSNYGYDSGYNVYTHAPAYSYVRKCHKRKIGFRKLYNPVSERHFTQPIFKRICHKVRVYH
ncbi:MAG: hypothetical protein AAF441_18375 [Pseudomonadota bacterium]